jgi:hypothetical protein
MVACGSAALYCPAGSASVKAVAPGNYTTPVDADETARTGELECEAGFACVGGTKESCAEDYFSNTGATNCKFCGPGEFVDDVNSVKSCAQCVAGKASAEGTTCVDCGIGEYSTSGSGFCTTVKAGEEVVKDGELRVSVKNCAAGSYSSGSMDTCTVCDATAGFVSSSEGQSSCTFCGPGTRADTTKNR